MITAATTTSITCNVGEGSYGTYEVEVIDGVKGKAQHDGGTLTFTYSMAISEISPTSGTIGGKKIRRELNQINVIFSYKGML